MEGILALHKPRGMTSHDCVFRIRKYLKIKKVGHTGTLDPEVNGVLPICIGEATKVASYLSDYDKEYIGQVTLGKATTTEDAYGEVVEEKEVERPITRQELLEACRHFTGEITQIPPMYSAVKVNGKKLYEYARQKIEVERPKRQVTIHEIELLSKEEVFASQEVSFTIRIRCSKGTYIRTLAYDIGRYLGYPAYLSDLVRTASGPFTLQDCVTFEDIEKLLDEHTFETCLHPMEKALAHLPSFVVSKEIESKVWNGAVLEEVKEMDERHYTVYNEEGQVIAIYQKHKEKQGVMKPVKVFHR